MSLDRNAQSLDRLRRVVQQIAASGGSGSTALADNSLISTSTGIKLNLNSTLITQHEFSVSLSTYLPSGTSYTAGVAAYLTSTGTGTDAGASALYGHVMFRGSTSSTSIWRGSTMLASKSTGLTFSIAASTSHVLKLSTNSTNTAWLLVDATPIISTTYTATSGPYCGFYVPLVNDFGATKIVGWEIDLSGTPVFIDLFPGSTYTANNTSLVSQNSTYLSNLSTGITLAAGRPPLFAAYNQGAASDGSRMQALGLDFNNLGSQTGQAFTYRRDVSNIYRSDNGIIVKPSTSTQTGGVSVFVDQSTIFINGSNQLSVVPGTSGLTSVDVSLPSTVFSTSNGPLVSNGTLSIPFTTQNSTLVFVGPSTGAAAVPVFRSLVGADVGFTTKGDVLTQLSTGLLTRVGIGTDGQVLTSASSTASGLLWTAPLSGTVTSVALALPVSVFTVSGSPVTAAGTLTGTFAGQTSTTFFAGPVSGAAATPTFRGIGQFDLGLLSTGDLLSVTSTGMTRLAKGTAGQVLRVSTNQATNLIWDNLGMSTKGDIVVLASTGVMSILPAGTTNQFLIVNSTSSTGLQWVDLGSSTILGSVLPLSTAGPDHDGGALYRTDTGIPMIQVRGNSEAFVRCFGQSTYGSTSGTVPVSLNWFDTTIPANYLSTGKMIRINGLISTVHGSNNFQTDYLLLIQGSTSTIWTMSNNATFGAGLTQRLRFEVDFASLGSTSTAPLQMTSWYTSIGSGTVSGVTTSTANFDITTSTRMILGSSTSSTNGGTTSMAARSMFGMAFN